MTETQEPFFLFLGDGDRESARSTLKSSGIPYVKKMLNSGPENWKKINDVLESQTLIGTVVKLTTSAVSNLFSQEYSEQSQRLLDQLSRVRHVIFIHENILTGDQPDPEPGKYDDDHELNFFVYRSIYKILSEKERQLLVALLSRGTLNFLVYKTNAELSISATGFLQENDKKLLFRVYLPRGRLWADEADKLLDLFRDWLAKVKGHRVRQGGYSTAHGQVYEFYATDELLGDAFSSELAEFSSFLDICVEDPDLATRILENSTSNATAVSTIVDRYAKEARRLRRDVKHARETKLLSIRQRLEVEFEDSDFDPTAMALNALNGSIPSDTALQNLLSDATLSLAAEKQNQNGIVINQNVINAANYIIAREVSGDIFQGKEALQLSNLINQHGGTESLSLHSALHELEDEDANASNRVTARQRIRTFLVKIADKTSGPALDILQKYIESKIGL